MSVVEEMHYDRTPMPLIVAKSILCLDRLHHPPNQVFSGSPLLLQVASMVRKSDNSLVSLFAFFLFCVISIGIWTLLIFFWLARKSTAGAYEVDRDP